MKPKLLLASGSPYRRQQLAQLTANFDWQAPSIDETPLANEPPADTALRLGIEKARALGSGSLSGYLIIAGDQTAALATQGMQSLGKPGTAAGACQQLQQCSGNTVTFYSSVCVLHSDTGQCLNDVVTTEVKFRQLSSQQIERYVERDQPLDCAGSFKCESLGIGLFESIHSSDPSALTGLPLIRLTQLLHQFNFDILL